MIDNYFLNRHVVQVEPCMDLAIVAIGVIHFFKIGVLYPILPIVASSKSHDNLIGIRSVPNIPVNLGNTLVDIKNISQGMILSRFTSPRRNAVIAESHSCKFHQLLRFRNVVGRSRLTQDKS